jgi:uncharacterized protein YfaS (alpha-2-macroglobulin family)
MNQNTMTRLAAAAVALACTAPALAAEVEVFSPQGEAKGVRQVAVRFTEPMVAFGDLRLADPFEVRCDGDAERVKGQGRWADPRNWAYDFAADLPAGQRCTFTLKPDLKSTAGAAMTGRREYSFHTGGPAVLTSMPAEGHEEIDGEQWFLLAFDAPVDAASLERGAWCEALGIGERIPLRLLQEADTRQLLESNRTRAHRLYGVYLKGRRAIPLARFRIEDKRWRNLPVVGVRCAQRLPAGAEAGLVIGEEVKTRTGLARGTPQRLAFRVRPDFTVKFSCERVNQDAACLPVGAMRLEFNAPVPAERARAIRLEPERGWGAIEPKLTPNAKSVEEVLFPGPLPEKTHYRVVLPRGFADDGGREPENRGSFPLAVATDENPPLVKFPGRFGILELNAEPVLPVTLRAVEPKLEAKRTRVGDAKPIPGRSVRLVDDEAQIIQRHMAMTEPEYVGRHQRPGEFPKLSEADRPVTFELPRTEGERAMEVVGIPLPKPGFHLVELASPRLGAALHGEDKPYYVATSALVTNLAVHLKHGRERSIVWVTALDSGKPVPGARVTVRDCQGTLHFEGETDVAGIADAGAALPRPRELPHCVLRPYLYAFARKGGDLSFTRSDWNQGIAPWNFAVPSNPWRGAAMTVHTVFDRTLFRAGETVSMKHVARVPVGRGFALPKAEELPRSAQVVHTGSGQRHPLEAKFDAQGTAETVWPIPAEAKLGEYRIQWRGRGEVSSSASFRVEAYRVPLMRAQLAPPKAPQVRPAAARVDAAVSYLAGGPAAYLPVKVRYRLEPRAVSFRDFPEFRFGGEPVKEGLREANAVEFWWHFDPDEGDPADPLGAPGAVATRSLTLDAAGTAAITLDKLPPVERPASLLVEMEYADPNGELLAASTRVPLHSAALYLGIRPEGWAASKDGVSAQLLAVDTTGKPLAGREVAVEMYLRTTYSHRRRLIGGFYAYDSSVETKRVRGGCAGTTDERGLLFCQVKPGASGQLLLVARAKDEAGNEALASTSVWVIGSREWWFDPADHDRIDLVPERKRYEPGETAKFQVRMPFREATVLVTVEREGVLEQKVVRLSGAAPVIEVRVAEHFGPNVFVSALAVRGRVDPEVPGPYAWLRRWLYRIGHWLGLVDEVPPVRDTRATALVDLAKPAYKLGIAEIKVGRRGYELEVKVTPEQAMLHPRATARVHVEVADAAGRPAAGAEIALAAVDEGLLELKDNLSWDILEGFMGQRPEEVVTSTAQGQVIGKRHFGRKALPPGGGGGPVAKSAARELFDTLLLWRARVRLDDAGRATLDVPLNDSLSSFRLVAVAHQGAAKFGSGHARVRSTQDLMLFSGLPPLVRELDEFAAMFTLRNTTEAALPVKLAWEMRSATGAKALAEGSQALELAPGEARLLSIPARVPVGVPGVQWEIAAEAAGVRDRLRVAQKVIPVHPVRVVQATLAQLDKPLEFPLERPADAVPGRGGVRVQVLATLAGELGPVREYFERYRYVCYEQRVSKAIGLRDEDMWRAVAASLPAHQDGDGLVKYFPVDWLQGEDALTAYVVQVAHAAGYEWPEGYLDSLLGALEGFVAGRIVRGSALPTADLAVRKLAAIEALARHDRANAAMLESITVDPPLWPTSALIDWIGILQRVADVPDRETRLAEALGQLRARINFQGTVMTFSTERSDALWWLMVSADVNANRALLALLAEDAWREDIGRLARGALSRQKEGIWGTTVANAWGVLAVQSFAEAFEKVPAAGRVATRIGEARAAIEVRPEPQQRDFAWPQGRGELRLAHEGEGAPWTIVQSRAAIPLKAPLSTGYAIKRSVAPIEQKAPPGYARGDVYRVTLEIDAQTDMTWVVIDDPIPSGAAILGSGLGRDAATLASGEQRQGWAWPAFIERSHDAYRAYYRFVPKGRFQIEYTVRLNNPGRFDLPATRVEAMYAPEMFGEVPNSPLRVAP